MCLIVTLFLLRRHERLQEEEPDFAFDGLLEGR